MTTTLWSWSSGPTEGVSGVAGARPPCRRPLLALDGLRGREVGHTSAPKSTLSTTNRDLRTLLAVWAP